MTETVRIIFGLGDKLEDYIPDLEKLKAKGVQVEAIDGTGIDTGRLPSPVILVLEQGQTKETGYGAVAVHAILSSFSG